MAIDPSNFHPINVIDTCAVWNVLSSRQLYSTARSAGCQFCMTDYVLYECLVKNRSAIRATDEELMSRLRNEQQTGAFKAHASTIADLQLVAQLEQRKRLGKGELSSIAFAMKINQAVMTDDQKARKLAHDVGHPMVQTTPHLFAWLLFKQRLVDAEKDLVIRQHKEMGQTLGPHLEDAYRLVRECAINSQPRP